MKRITALFLALLMLVCSLTSCLYAPSPSASDTSSTQQTSDDTKKEEIPNKITVSVGKQMALASAKEYLALMAFSKQGLAKQLEFEGFTSEEIAYAVEHCGADWKEQAVRSANEYLETFSFSKKALIDQLEFEGFTPEEAAYGAEQAYK